MLYFVDQVNVYFFLEVRKTLTEGVLVCTWAVGPSCEEREI
jgi:hypothetical protein